MERDRVRQAGEREIKTQERHRIEQKTENGEKTQTHLRCHRREPEGKTKAGSTLQPPPALGS